MRVLIFKTVDAIIRNINQPLLPNQRVHQAVQQVPHHIVSELILS